MKKIIKFLLSMTILLSLNDEVLAQSCWFNVPNAICSGTNLAVTFQSGTTIHYVSGYSYSVSGNTININISGVGTGNQSVYIGYSCQGSWYFNEYYDSFWYGTPPINAQDNISLCSGTGLNLQLYAAQNAPGMNFGWSSYVSSGSVSGNGSGLDAGGYIADVLSGSGTVTYTIYTQLGSCQSPSKTFNVTVSPGSSTGNGISGSTSACLGSTTVLTATGSPYNFYWQKWAVSGSQIPGDLDWVTISGSTNLTSISYYVPDVDYVQFRLVGNSCAANPLSSTFTINNIKPLPSLTFSNFSGSNTNQAPVCSGGAIYAGLSATPGSNISWTSSVLSGSASGIPGSGSGLEGAQWYTIASSATVTSQADATIRYDFIANKNGCLASLNNKIVMVPSMYLTGIPTSDITICSGENAGVSLTKATTGSISYTGTVITGSVVGTLTGTDTNINEPLTNSGTGQAHVQYLVTLTNGGCTRQEIFNVYVNNIPDPGEILVSKNEFCGAGYVALEIQNNTDPVKIQYRNGSTGGVYQDLVGKTIYYVTENTDFVSTLVTPLCGVSSSTLKSVVVFPDPEPGVPEDKAYHQASASFNLEIDRVAGYGYEVYDPINTVVFNSPSSQSTSQFTVSPSVSTRYKVYAKTDDNCVSTNYATLDANFFGGDVPLSNPITAADSYVRSYTAGQAGLTELSAYTSPYQMSIATEYVDGLGRSLQTVQRQASPDATDVIVPVEYDQFGRQVRNYLPYTNANQTGNFDTDPYYNQHQYYQSPPTGVAGDLYSFGQTGYEKSPLSRVVETAAPGFTWYPGFDFNYVDRKTARTNYRMNIASLDGTIVKWTNGAYSSYANNQLYVTESIDENGHEVREFQDKEGKTILKRVQAEEDQSVWANTYYSYDDFGNLVTVLPPEASKLITTAYAAAEPGFTVYGTNHNVTALEANDKLGYAGGATITISAGITLTPGFEAKPSAAIPPSTQSIDNWIFQYKYDSRNRMVQKKVPGADWMYMVYDERDRLVLTQDGIQRQSNQWSFTKYDQLNRPILTGIYTHGAPVDQYTMQIIVKDFYTAAASNSDEWFEIAGATVHGYTDLSFPKGVTASDYLTVTYYDKYNVSDTWGTAYAYEDLNLTGSFNSITYNQPDARSPKVVGQITASMVKNLDDNSWLKSVNYYDDKYRVVQAVADNQLSGVDRTTSVYDFVGKVLLNQAIHMDGASNERIVTRTFDYDHAGRLINTWHKVDSDATILLAHNEYNKVGQLIDKKLHSEDNGTAYKQSVDYRYNIRGWLTSINNADLSNDGTTNNDNGDLFGMNLLYDQQDAGLANAPQLNGNISAMKWSANLGLADVKSHGYNYTYDPLNRIKGAAFHKKNSGWSSATEFGVSGFDYDLNGNILALTRKNKSGTNMDALTYNYGSGNTLGNQLRWVTDAGDITKGFADGNTSGDDYLYDANGNMTEDKNKDITGIAYNHLNLPRQVTKGTGEYIKYIYDASGRKLSQEVYDGSSTLTKATDYVGEYVYENDTLRFINTEEGRITLEEGNPEYQYHLKDHLGNVRLTFTSKSEQEANVATMETEHVTEEASEFLHYNDVRKINSSLFDHTGLSATQYALRLNGSTNERIGLAKSLAVVPGDTIRMEVYAKYVDPVNTNWTTAMTNLLNAIANGTAPAGTVIDGAGYASGGSNAFAYGGSLTKTGETGTAPKAYLNYLVFDEDFVPDLAKSGFKRMSEVAKEDGTDVAHEKLDWEINISQPGYVYIWLSNDQVDLGGNPVEVYFDDFKVNHVKSPVISSSEYYPFGLTFNSYQRENATKNKYLYNDGSELQTDLNLGVYQAFYRILDPTIGRWWQIDPRADSLESLTPYNSMFNNPLRFNDPLGDCPPEDPNCNQRSRGNTVRSALQRNVTSNLRSANNSANNIVKARIGTQAAGLGGELKLGKALNVGGSARAFSIDLEGGTNGSNELSTSVVSTELNVNLLGVNAADLSQEDMKGTLSVTENGVQGDIQLRDYSGDTGNEFGLGVTIGQISGEISANLDAAGDYINSTVEAVKQYFTNLIGPIDQ